jgi:ribokinase
MTTHRGTRTVTVVGSIVMDHKWHAVGGLMRDSTEDYPLWRVERRHGGVGRNVAENLARLGVPVFFAGLSGVDHLAKEIEDRLREAGVRLAVARMSGGVGRFDVHLDDAGGLTRSRISLPRDELLTWDLLISALPELGDAAVVGVETGLAVPMVAMLRDYTRQRGIRLLGMPTRLADHGPRWPLIREMDILVLNEVEAAIVTRLPGGDLRTARAQISKILTDGPSTVVLTCGDRGVLAASAEEPEPLHFPARQVRCIDDTGAGDALTAALLAGLVEGADLATAVTMGLEAARITVGCPDSSCRRINELADTACSAARINTEIPA